jgi:hypothetical protein
LHRSTAGTARVNSAALLLAQLRSHVRITPGAGDPTTKFRNRTLCEHDAGGAEGADFGFTYAAFPAKWEHIRDAAFELAPEQTPDTTEIPIRVDNVMETPKLAE